MIFIGTQFCNLHRDAIERHGKLASSRARWKEVTNLEDSLIFWLCSDVIKPMHIQEEEGGGGRLCILKRSHQLAVA